MSWLKKAKMEISNWSEQLNNAFRSMISPVGNFFQSSEPYLGEIEFLNEDKTYQITANIGWNITGFLEANIIIKNVRGKKKGFSIKKKMMDRQVFADILVKRIYDVIHLMERHEQKSDEEEGQLAA